jgi:SUMO ligase MMS21 Smc5/6 complex component
MENPEEMDIKMLNSILNATEPGGEEREHPKFAQFCELIENFKNGDSMEEDLVLDTNKANNQVRKCPITGKAIVNAVKNSRCDHTYEREAILAYIKRKPNPKCPFAGCSQVVSIKY